MSTQPDQWMTIREAAMWLGVSDLTVRRRIKDGRLVHRLQDGKYFVNPSVPVARPVQTSPTLEAPLDTSSPASASVALPLEHILPEYGRLSEQAGRARVLEQRVAQLEGECQALRDGLISLSGRNGWLESKLDEREQTLKLLSDRRKKPSWWRRVMGASEDSR